ncbi:MAG: UDP-2,4-diacetamido-2,4,6-trideoxy-beta-L-altropyranose hydrolase [Hyphomonadaceae bacterium]
MANKHFVFRADAGAALGGGHVMRCLTLAHALARRGAVCRFVSLRGSDAYAPALAASGFSTSWVDNALDTAEAANAMGRADAVIVDHYDLGAQAEAAFRQSGGKIIAIDDLADRAHACDVLIDHTLGRTARDYAGRVPEEARLLLGPRYAFVRPEFQQARTHALARRRADGPVRRILVSMGLTDVGGVSLPAVEAALAAAPGAAVDVVLAAQAPSRAALEARAAIEPRVRVLPANADMCALMAEADMAIGAGGTTAWERCCLGLPSVVLVVAENQVLNAGRLAAAGAILLAEGEAGLAAAAAELAGNAAARHAMSGKAAALVAADGADHTADILLHSLGGLPAARRGAVFFDRDGVLNVDHGYVSERARFQWMPGAREAVKLANEAGLYAFVVTNQSGVGRGKYTEEDVRALHDFMAEELAEVGARIDAFSYCPDHPEAEIARYRRVSPRRKPAPGMLLDLIAEWPVDTARSLMVGDKASDMAAAAAAGVRGELYEGGPLDAWLAARLPA